MASDPNAPRSRRALLAAAAGGAAAVAASAAMPLTAAAADPNDVVKGVDNPTTAETSITQSAAGFIALKASTANPDRAGLVGATGDQTDSNEDFSTYTGVYGWSPTQPDPDFFATGVWGDSDDVGAYGSGTIGLMGDGLYGVVGRGDAGGTAVQAQAFDEDNDVGLRVLGKVQFSRAGRTTIGAGRSSIKITRAGVTSSSRIFAVLHSNRAGRYVRAVVPTTGSFTIYLNTTVTSATYVAWFVIN
jgi:hypothetical protein